MLRQVTDVVGSARAVTSWLAVLPLTAPGHVRALEGHLYEAIDLVTALAADVRAVRRLIEPTVASVLALEAAVARIELRLDFVSGDVAHVAATVDDVSEAVPDPDTNGGPLARVREALSGD